MSDQSAVIKAVCISEKKGQQKHPVESVHLRPEHGIDGDAHAGREGRLRRQREQRLRIPEYPAQRNVPLRAQQHDGRERLDVG